MEQSGFFHAVRLIRDQCKGCVNCIKQCPTEAIRVREGKAAILQDRCIDCGQCIRVCPNRAKTAVANTLDDLVDYPVKIALPAPALYAQFDETVSPGVVLGGLLDLGFDDIFEVAVGADIVGHQLRRLIESHPPVRPLISSACPAVVRLIQVRFPNLIDNIAPVSSPMRVASRIARPRAACKFHVPPDQVGIFFITPCPGKVAAVMEPVGYTTRTLDGAIPIRDVFGPLSKAVRARMDSGPDGLKPHSSGQGMGWARSGGENQAVGVGRHISVDGVHNVIGIFEDIERGKLTDVDYIEAQACVGGCVGGVLNVENPFIARRRVSLLTKSGKKRPAAEIARLIETLKEHDYQLETPVEARTVMALSADMSEAIYRMEKLEEIASRLPGLDCGSCGAPTCQALAEDIVRGQAIEADCIFLLRRRVRDLAEELSDISAKVPPAMDQGA